MRARFGDPGMGEPPGHRRNSPRLKDLAGTILGPSIHQAPRDRFLPGGRIGTCFRSGGSMGYRCRASSKRSKAPASITDCEIGERPQECDGAFVAPVGSVGWSHHLTPRNTKARTIFRIGDLIGLGTNRATKRTNRAGLLWSNRSLSQISWGRLS